MRFLVGGYGADMDGHGTGIGVLRAGDPESPLASGSLGIADAGLALASPSWLAPHPSLDVVYAALEGRGQVQALRRTGEAAYATMGAPVDAGELVCHIAVAPDGGSLLASCWGDGRLVRMTLDGDGRPSRPSIAPAAVDPYGSETDTAPADEDLDLAAAARALREAAGAEYAHLIPYQDRPDTETAPEPETVSRPGTADRPVRQSRAHQARHLSDGVVATTDMGLDLIRFWRGVPGGLKLAQQVALPGGCGPRHMVSHPSGHLYVVAELTCEVFALAHDRDGVWRVVGGTALSPATLPGDAAAELASSRDGEVLYAGVRGSDTIATLRVRGDGSRLEQLALAEAGVAWPRHHVVVRDTLLVAGQRSDEIASLALDSRSGAPGRARHRVAAPSPTCLLPLPGR